MWGRCAAASLGGPTARPERPPPGLIKREQIAALARLGIDVVAQGTVQHLAGVLRSNAASAEAKSILAACVESPILHDTTTLTEPPTRQRGTSGNGPLTHRELTILTLLASALSEADIGRNLFVSHSTVHSHVKSIYRKLGVCSRAAALKTAHAAGFR